MHNRWQIVVVFISMSVTAQPANPLLTEWNTPFQIPPFHEIKEEHFLPAFKEAMTAQLREVEVIAQVAEPATFGNTIEALEETGDTLTRVNSVFSNLNSANTNPKLQAVARELAPLQSAHHDAILLNPALFGRVKALWDSRDTLSSLSPEQKTLLEKTWKRFVRGGAQLDADKKERLRAINSELASLSVRFGDNNLKEMNDFRLVLDKGQLGGLPQHEIDSAAEAARKDGMSGKYVFTLHAPSLWPFMQYSDNRELRRQMFQAYTSRGDHDDATDNKQAVARMAALRSERARMLGYNSWADYVLEDSMAKTPERVYELLNRLWDPAKAVAASEAAAMQQMIIRAEGKSFSLEPWDWFYYAEKVRQARYALDESALRPYFKLENVRDGAFDVARKLYGITFTPLKDVPVYNEEVQAFEVKDQDGAHLAVFYLDFHPRSGKRSGAWASSFRSVATRNGRSIRPITINVCNFSRATAETPALLTLDEVETLFHEFGHGLHGMLSQVHYRSLGSTPRDFVELPSQIMENWAMEPAVLKSYARHWRTGEPIPDQLIDKIQKTEQFNQGFKTVEYLAASLLDLEWHTIAVATEPDAATLERMALARMGIPRQIVPRYRSTYFQHIFSGGYSAGYYSYIWAEVLDSDAFALFKEKGIFDAATARSFRKNILEKGQTEDPALLYERFRGRAPVVEPLLRKRGLLPMPERVTDRAPTGET